jgi:hypothetical protein
MDKAPAYGAGDSGFESRYGLFFFFNLFYFYFILFILFLYFFPEKQVLPGLEPGLQGSKPWVLTNYTIEPRHVGKAKQNNYFYLRRDLNPQPPD